MLVHEQLLTAAGKQACKPFGATSSAPALTAATALLCTLALWSLAYAPPGETLREVARGDLAPRRRQRRGARSPRGGSCHYICSRCMMKHPSCNGLHPKFLHFPSLDITRGRLKCSARV